MKYFLKVFGCQMNYSDAERISAILVKYKLKQTASTDEADFVIFVTCGVRQSAENRVYGQINNLRKKYPQKIIILTGCLAHRKDVQRRLKDKVNLFIPIKEITNSNKWKNIISRNIEYSCYSKNIQYSLKKIPNIKHQIPNTKSKLYDDYLKITPKYTNLYTAYIPIMTGCNNFCTYCVVPYARGREYSRPVENILKEIKNLVKKGYKEIILLGQNVNSYCFRNKNSSSEALDEKDKCINFPKLLQLIEKIPGKFWITFLTSHPKDMSDELIETIAKSKKICEYISLPAQSGDDMILKKMNRHYTIKHYKTLIKKILKSYLEPRFPIGNRGSKLPPSISTDIIVGFPGETKKQFENSAKLFREMKFDMAYISQYSPRPETAACKFEDNVSKKEKSRREKVLTEILAKSALANNKKYIGKIVEVLVDRALPAKASPKSSDFGMLAGHTRTQKKVVFSSNKKIPVGSFVKVKITKAKAFGLEGEIN